MTDLERLQRIAADIRELTTFPRASVTLGIDHSGAMGLLSDCGGISALHNYEEGPVLQIESVSLTIDGVEFRAQRATKEVAR